MIAILAGVSSCSDGEAYPEAMGESFIGTWVEHEYRGDTLLLDRDYELDPDRYGFIIHGDGRFTEHKNSGWCGTPPISYAEFEGRWELHSDSLLNIVVDFWGGRMSYQIQLLELSGSRMAIRYHFEEDIINQRLD